MSHATMVPHVLTRDAIPPECEPRNELERLHREALTLANQIECWTEGFFSRLTGEGDYSPEGVAAARAVGHLTDAQVICERLRRAADRMDQIAKLG